MIALLLALALPVMAQSSGTVRDQNRIDGLDLSVNSLLSGRPTITGFPYFQGGTKVSSVTFQDGSQQNTAYQNVGGTVAVTAALTGNGSDSSKLGVNSSSVAVLNASGFVQNFQIDPASVTKQGFVSLSNLTGSVPQAQVNLSTVTTWLQTLLSSGPVPTGFINLSTVTTALNLKLDNSTFNSYSSTITSALQSKLSSGAVPSGFVDLSTVTTALATKASTGTDNSMTRAQALKTIDGPLTVVSSASFSGVVGINGADATAESAVVSVKFAAGKEVGFVVAGGSPTIQGVTGGGANYAALSLDGWPLTLNLTSGKDIVTGSGNFGIGTTIPAGPLDVRKQGGTTNLGLFSNGTRAIQLYTDTSYAIVGTSTNHSMQLGANNGAAILNINQNGGVGVGSYGPALTAPPSNGLIVSGSVGVGTSSPGTTLDVNGAATIRAQETVVSSITIVSGVADSFQLQANSGRAYNATGYGGIGLVSNDAAANQLFGEILLHTDSTVGNRGLELYSFDSNASAFGNVYLPFGKTGIGQGALVGLATTLDVNGNAQFGSGVTKSTFSTGGDLNLASGADVTVSGVAGYITGQSSITTTSGVFADYVQATHALVGASAALGGAAGNASLDVTGGGRFSQGLGVNGGLNTSAPLSVKVATGKEIEFDILGTTQTIFGGITNAANYAALGIDGSPLVLNHNTAKDVIIADAGGNVGVGTPSPAAPLDVLKQGSTSNVAFVRNGTRTIQLYTDTTYALIGSSTNHNFFIGANNGSALTMLHTNGGLSVGTYGTSLNTPPAGGIIASGNVGIGTASPGAPLSVVGTNQTMSLAPATGTGATWLQFANTGQTAYIAQDNSSGSQFGGGNYALNLYGSGNFPMNLWTNANQRMTILGSGEVGIGTASPGYKLHIEGNAAIGTGGYLRFLNSANDNFGDIKSVGGSGSAAIELNAGGGSVGIGKIPSVPLDVAGAIAGTSSVTASAFFGDGSHLTGVSATGSTFTDNVTTSKNVNGDLNFLANNTSNGSNATTSIFLQNNGVGAQIFYNSPNNSGQGGKSTLNFLSPAGGVSGSSIAFFSNGGTDGGNVNPQFFIGASSNVGVNNKIPTTALSVYGVITSSTTQGSISCSAGTGVLDARCTDDHCTYAAGTLATNCTYTFAVAKPKKPDCVCGTDAATPIALSALATTTTVKCTAAGALTGDNVTFICAGAP